MRGRKLVRERPGRVASGWSVLALGLMVSVGFFLLPSTAVAAAIHSFKETFGSVSQPSFSRPMGLALDQSNEALLVIDVEAKTVSRFNLDGTPASFSALGSNVIDGAGGADKTPQEGLSFGFGNPREVQVAVDNSGGATDGNIYVTQSENKLIDIFAEDGHFLGQLTASSEGALGEICGVGADAAGAVYLGDFSNGKIHKYVPAGDFPVNGDNIANFTRPNACTLAAGAGPSSGFIFSNLFGGELGKLDSTTGEEKYTVDSGSNVTVTVDPASGNVYTVTGSEVKEYDASGTSATPSNSSIKVGSEVTGVAVNEVTGDVYIARSNAAKIEVWGPALVLPEAATEAASEITATSVTLNGTVSAAGGAEASCKFQYTNEDAFSAEGFKGAISVPCSPPGPFAGTSEEAVSAAVEGLSPGTRYFFRVLASNQDGSVDGGTLSFFTLGPSVTVGLASQITATGARISGQVNPRSKATNLQVQYVSEAQFEENEYAGATAVPVEPLEVGSGSAFNEVLVQLSGLSPNTAYHFRLTATNADATSFGPDRSFATFIQTTNPLPDNRGYEMVSPPQKAGEVIPPEPATSLGEACFECLPGQNLQIMPMQSTLDGQAVLYEGQPFSAGLAAGPNEYLADRTPSEWSSKSLSEPLTTGRYLAFQEDLSHSVLYQVEPPLSPEAPTRGGESFANLYLRSEDGAVQPLVTEEPPQRDPGFPVQAENQFRIRYAGANKGSALSPPFSHLIFEANDALSEEVAGVAPEAPEVPGGQECTLTGGECNLYEWGDGGLRLINVLPGNAEAVSDAVIGSGRLLVKNSDLEAPDVDRAISNDGNVIFWSSEASGQVFARIAGKETLEVPGPGNCKKDVVLENRACFLTASADGSSVLLSDGQIFEFDEEAAAYEPLADLTEGKGGFEGILGVSENLSRVYFVDTEALSEASEENANGEHAEANKLNLYGWEEGALSFIGRLSANDNLLGLQSRYGDWKASRPNRTAQVSPDGRWLAFLSQAPLTGYDSALSGGGECYPAAGEACFEIFVYSIDTQILSCASCNPSRQRPLGTSNLSLLRPGNPKSEFPPFPQPDNLSANGEGRVFFESQDALSPQDTNGSVQDVYEWEPDGVGSCQREGGCISLISSGHSPNHSMFLDSSSSGDDVFFITREQLLPRDRDQQLDLYDARVNGGFSEIGTSPCRGELCRGAIASPPPQASFGSAEFTGPGNQANTCKRGFVKKGSKCVKKAKKRQKRKRARHPGGSK
jgi:hypothetical protein